MELFEQYVDIIQIGSRNMHNFALLRAAGQGRKPVLLKRGFGATIEEWLMAAEYVLSAGNSNVILCERGIRTFEHATRNTLDLSAVPVLREMTHLPVIVDPSHGTGKRSLVPPMALGAAAVGADGLIIEVHPDPPHARSDGDQSLSFPEFGDAHGRPAPARVPAARQRAGHGAGRRRRRSVERHARPHRRDRRRAARRSSRSERELALAIQDAKGPDGHGHDVERERDLMRASAVDADGGVMDARRARRSSCRARGPGLDVDAAPPTRPSGTPAPLA